ncbi:A24 family peptidase [Vibrio breoganii]|uniref:prepilin peptidase n=3 Tax=Vibrio TaxID=662 RepID=UPI000CC4729B|nr:A24 family peptidase [Vibrio breoganii]PML19298.1 hypothetical protein BCT84_18665 [Vibrio breoganii]
MELFNVVVFGLLVGSFLNVVIYRLPLMEMRDYELGIAEYTGDASVVKTPLTSLCSPSSACTSCGTPIRWYHNIPVISYLALRGRCAKCGESYRFRYLLVECMSGVFAGLLYVAYGLTAEAFFWYVITMTLICIAYIDFDHLVIPEQLTKILLAVALLLGVSELSFVNNPFTGEGGAPFMGDAHYAVYSALVIYVIYTFLGVLVSKVLKKTAMGYGDVVLTTVLAGIFGLNVALIYCVVLPSVVFLAVATCYKYARSTAYPFGPYISLGAIFYISATALQVLVA